MRLSRARFTIRWLMAVVAIVALVMVVGRLNEFEASLLFSACYFVVPPTLTIVILRTFEPNRSRR